MGLLDDTTQYEYYTGNDKGSYQFTSLEDIINQFLVAYVGEEKIISKANRVDVAFHAQRAMQELSFDTFKSIKSQEIVLPPSLTMILPHDYVNYTKVLWSDSSGIKHPIYPTKHTQNPFKILQETDGAYDFSTTTGSLNLENHDFSSSLDIGWEWSPVGSSPDPIVDSVSVNGAKLQFDHGSKAFIGVTGSRGYAVWQIINVQGLNNLDLKATVKVAASAPGNYLPTQYNSFERDAGLVRVGVTRSLNVNGWDPTITNPASYFFDGSQFIENSGSKNHLEEIFDLETQLGGPSCITWGDDAAEEDTESTQSMSDSGNPGLINVESHDEVYIVITSHIPNFTDVLNTVPEAPYLSRNLVDDIEIISEGANANLQLGGESTTWSNYKASGSSSDNIIVTSDAQDIDFYNHNEGQRYGLEPQHAQTNGSFFIDNLRGLINFSSNISGKTVILDYISDSLGTDGEMQVHKFAEEAMYKWIMYAMLSTRANTPEYIVRRYQKEKFAATRQAKLRLSNIKLEELTQILRGKSKHIKH